MSPLLLLLLACAPAVEDCVSPLVLAASDLQYAFAEIGERYAAEHGCAPTVSFGSTGAFATQIENGARADAFFAANAVYVDRLEAGGMLVPGTRTPYAIGRLVLAAAPTFTGRFDGLAAAEADAVHHVAIANPEHAPYGVAAKQALSHEGRWERLSPRIVQGENVVQAMQLVQSGNAELGIVALSIALGTPGARYTPLDAALHDPLLQVAAVPARAEHPDAGRRLIAFVTGDVARPILETYGSQAP